MLDELESKRKEHLQRARREAEQILSQTREQAQALIESLRQQAGAPHKPHEAVEQVKEARAELRGLEEGVEEALPEPEPPPPAEPEPERKPPPPSEVMPGQRVMVRAVEQKGTVLTAPDEERQVDVQVGLLRMRVGLEDLEVLPDEPSGTVGEISAREVAPELHLRGLRVDEAIYRLERYLDDAVLAGLSQVRIVHGYGTGAVRNAVLEVLRQHPQVKSYRPGERGEGGGGATVAELEA